MGKRKLKRCILIVCEGAKTEHDYFEYIATHISYKNNIWDKIEVCDNETVPQDIAIASPTELGKRKKRQFVNPNKKKISKKSVLKELCKDIYGQEKGIEYYEDVRAFPLRFVAQAQLIEQKQQMYEELWAVFDMDGHSHHQQAYDKAEEEVNGKKVQIGFTSRSFEHWLLLHFEKNTTSFYSSECKDERKKPLGCNPEQGCKGETCLAGYLRSHTPLKNYEKSNNAENLKATMDLLLSPKFLNAAFNNAEWLRNEIKKDETLNDKKCFELNPYTDVDFLVKRLIE